MHYAAFLPGSQPAEWTAWASRYETAGFSSLWQGELMNSSLIPLAALLPSTRRIDLGTGVALAFTHSPVMLTFAAMDMDLASGGRFRLGLGVAHPNRNNHWYAGRDAGRPIAQLREYVEVSRLVMEKAQVGGELEYEGEFYRLRARNFFARPTRQPRPRVPIYLAAVQRQMARLAGEVADGLIGNPLFSVQHVRDVVAPAVAEGLARANRSRADLELMGQCFTVIEEDPDTAYEVAARALLFSIWARIYDPVFSAHGFEDVVSRVRDAQKSGAGLDAARVVPREMVDAFCAVGARDRVCEAIDARREHLDTLILTVPSTGLSPDDQARYRERILETFGSPQ